MYKRLNKFKEGKDNDDDIKKDDDEEEELKIYDIAHTDEVYLREQRLIPSGAQSWYSNMISEVGGGDESGMHSPTYLAYCSTLAVFLLDKHNFQVKRILTGHTRTISSFIGNPHRNNLIATASIDGRGLVKSITSGSIISSVNMPHIAINMTWSPLNNTHIYISFKNGHISLWDISTSVSTITPIYKHYNKNKYNIYTNYMCFDIRCNNNILILGNSDGSIYILDINQGDVIRKYIPHDDDLKGVITGIDIDVLSDTFLLVSYKNGTIVLWDIDPNLYSYQKKKNKDINENYIRVKFEKQGIGITSLKWMDWAPGNFLTTTSRSGVIRIWNISQKQPLEHIKISTYGITSLIFITNTNTTNTNTSNNNNRIDHIGYGKRCFISLKDGSIIIYNFQRKQIEYKSISNHTETIFTCKFHPFNPYLLVTGSYDETIKIWNTKNMSIEGTYTGHHATIYTVAWSPNGKQLISGDSNANIILWEVLSEKVIRKYGHHLGPIYDIKWHPRDSTIIGAASQDLKCSIFHPNGSIISFLEHPAAVFGLSFTLNYSELVATSCQDGNIRIFNYLSSKKPLYILKGSKARTFHVLWSPLRLSTIAASSDDGIVRVWDVDTKASTKTTFQPICNLKGHQNKVRGLLWSYEYDNILISGSWDAAIIVWDIDQGVLLQRVQNHLADVYGLDSHPDRPYTIITTSRDTTLRFWELKKFQTSPLISSIIKKKLPLKTLIIESNNHNHSNNYYNNIFIPTKQHYLSGKSSQKLSRIINNYYNNNNINKLYQKIFEFFSTNDGMIDLWLLISDILKTQNKNNKKRIKKRRHEYKNNNSKYNDSDINDSDDDDSDNDDSDNDDSDNDSYNNNQSNSSISKLEDDDIDEDLINNDNEKSINNIGKMDKNHKYYRQFMKIPYHKNFIKISENKAKLCISKGEKRVGGIIREDEKIEASISYLRAGNIKEYCNIMISLNQWEKALAIAPAVSKKYWLKLLNLYIKEKEETQHTLSENEVPYLMAAGEWDKLIEFYTERNELTAAILISKVMEKIALIKSNKKKDYESKGKDDDDDNDDIDDIDDDNNNNNNNNKYNKNFISKQTKNLFLTLGYYHLSLGEPYLAAAAMLSCNDIDNAIYMLDRGNEVEASYAIRECMNKHLPHYLWKELIRRAEYCQDFNLTYELYEYLPQGNILKRLFFSKFCTINNIDYANEFYDKNNLRSIESYLETAEEEEKNNSLKESLINYIMALDSNNSIRIAKILIEQNIDNIYNLNNDDSFLSLLNIIHHINLKDVTNVKERAEFLAYMCYIGAQVAIYRQLYSIVSPLLRICLQLIRDHYLNKNNDFLFNIHDIFLQQMIYGILLSPQFVIDEISSYMKYDDTIPSKHWNILDQLQKDCSNFNIIIQNILDDIDDDINDNNNNIDDDIDDDDDNNYITEQLKKFSLDMLPKYILNPTSSNSASINYYERISIVDPVIEKGLLKYIYKLLDSIRLEYLAPSKFRSKDIISIGSQLPDSTIYQNVQISIVSGLIIHGPKYSLNDPSQSIMSLNEALMWVRVNPYAPLLSGIRLNPI